MLLQAFLSHCFSIYRYIVDIYFIVYLRSRKENLIAKVIQRKNVSRKKHFLEFQEVMRCPKDFLHRFFYQNNFLLPNDILRYTVTFQLILSDRKMANCHPNGFTQLLYIYYSCEVFSLLNRTLFNSEGQCYVMNVVRI